MSNEIVNDSHIENDVEEVFQDDSQEFDIREAFGLPAKNEEEESEEGEQSVNDKTPAKEDVKDTKKTIVKFNKEDVEIDDDKIPELLQKGLALDKERDRAKQSQTDLDRAAKLLGYKDHADLAAGLDALEQQQQQKQQTDLDELRNDMLDQLEANGLDRTKAEEWINNHPLIKQGEEAIVAQQKVTAAQEENKRWKPLYESYPEIDRLAKAGDYSWATPELLELSKRNDPLLAYEHLNKSATQSQTKKQVEQKLIKQQQLSSRSKVETIDGEQENRASEELRGAFALFGIDPKRAQKYAK